MDKPVSYMQCDKRWGKIDYSVKGESTNICESGCGPTAMAMALSTFLKREILPPELCKWSLEHGHKALRQGTYYAFFKPCGEAYGVKTYQLNWKNLRKNRSIEKGYHRRVLEELSRGNYVIACMGPGNWTNGGHFILLYGVAGDTAYVNDPNSTNKNRTQGSWERLKKEVKYYFIVERPKGSVKVSAFNEDKPSPWAIKAWDKAVSKQIMDGSRPKEALKREEFAVVLDRLGLLDGKKNE